MKTTEIIELLKKTKTEAENEAKKYPYMKDWYEGKAEGLTIAIYALELEIRKEKTEK